MLLAGLAFCITFVANMPAQIAVMWTGAPVLPSAIGGTLWHGSAQIDPAHVLRWQTAWGRSLTAGAIVADVSLQGPGTALAGEVTARPARNALRVEGTAAWPLVAALRPDLPTTCDTTIVLRLSGQMSRDGRAAEGHATSGGGRCAIRDGSATDIALPPLVYRVTTGTDGITLTVDTDATPPQPMAEARLTTEDRVIVILRQAAAAMVPGLPTGGDFELDLPLAAVLP